METVMEPQDVSDALLAFPAQVSDLMPSWESIPEEYRRGRNWANGFQRDWFFFGLESMDLPWKEGIDSMKAMRHLAAIQGSFEPKHEHKEAAVAYLVDSWTEGEGSWEKRERT